MRLIHLAAVAFLCGIITLSGFATAQAPATRPVGESTASAPTVTLVYDISDLIRPRNNYPGAGSGGSAGGFVAPNFTRANIAPGGVEGGMGFVEVPMGGAPGQPPPGDLAGGLVRLIEETIDPSSWRDAGGTTGSIRELAGQLVVTQSKQSQALIERLLSEMRNQGPGQMVCVRAYWLVLTAQDIAGIFDASRKELGPDAMPTVPDALTTGDKLYCQGQTICFNGQTVHITSGRQWSVVSKLNPVVGSNAVGYDPQLSVANSGVSLQVMPQIVPRKDSAILDLRSTVTETRGPTGPSDLDGRPASSTQPSIGEMDPSGANPFATAAARIDRLNVVNQEFATTVRLPLGKKVLLGGMTLEPASKTDPGRQLYLVVELDAMK